MAEDSSIRRNFVALLHWRSFIKPGRWLGSFCVCVWMNFSILLKVVLNALCSPGSLPTCIPGTWNTFSGQKSQCKGTSSNEYWLQPQACPGPFYWWDSSIKLLAHILFSSITEVIASNALKYQIFNIKLQKKKNMLQLFAMIWNMCCMGPLFTARREVPL